MSETTKGEFGGACNRGACSNTDAMFFNQSTRAYYCRDCAVLLNRVNPELIDGARLCVSVNDPAHPHHMGRGAK